jgi:DNA repair protein RadC
MSEALFSAGNILIREVRASYVSAPVVEAGADSFVARNPEGLVAILETLYEPKLDPQENLFAIYFNSKNQVIGTERVYRGTVNAATVSTRDIVRNALIMNAAAIVISHNHPSGDPGPTAEDLVFTRRLDDACRLFGIELLDHIVLGNPRFVSLRQRGVL